MTLQVTAVTMGTRDTRVEVDYNNAILSVSLGEKNATNPLAGIRVISGNAGRGIDSAESNRIWRCVHDYVGYQLPKTLEDFKAELMKATPSVVDSTRIREIEVGDPVTAAAKVGLPTKAMEWRNSDGVAIDEGMDGRVDYLNFVTASGVRIVVDGLEYNHVCPYSVGSQKALLRDEAGHDISCYMLSCSTYSEEAACKILASQKDLPKK